MVLPPLRVVRHPFRLNRLFRIVALVSVLTIVKRGLRIVVLTDVALLDRRDRPSFMVHFRPRHRYLPRAALCRTGLAFNYLLYIVQVDICRQIVRVHLCLRLQ